MKYNDINEYELIYLIRDSDDKYLKLLFEKYSDLLGKLAKTYSIKYKIDYEDLYQEAYIGLNEAIRNYTEYRNTSFKTYLYICITAKLNDYLRKSKRGDNILLANSCSLYVPISEELILLDNISEGDTTYNTVLSRENGFELIKFKNSLEVVEAQIFELRINGFKVKEISQLLDISTSVINYKLRKIKKLCKDNCIF